MAKAPEALEIPAEAPSRTRALTGHQTQWRRFVDAFDGGQPGHGYILAGPSGVGKATFAFRAARYLLAGTEPDAELSGRTDRLVAGLAHPDLLVLDSGRDPGKRPIVPVEEVRRSVQFLNRTAAGSGRRVVILDKSDHLNRNAANALLKALEEPPPDAVMLLVCDRPGRLLPTLRSRCQIIRFEPLETGDTRRVLDDLAGRGVLPTDEGGWDRAIALSAGSPGQAMRMLKQDLVSLLDQIDVWLDPAGQANPSHSQKIAATLSPRDSHDAYALAMARLRFHLHSATTAASSRGQRLNAAAEFWIEMSRREADVDAFNLDRMPFLLWALNTARHTIMDSKADQ
ncbi:MAG: AAA family ATPase [Pseudomonadota bacterium]